MTSTDKQGVPETTEDAQRASFDAGYACAVELGNPLAAAWQALPRADSGRTLEEIAEDYIAWCRRWAPALNPEPVE